MVFPWKGVWLLLVPKLNNGLEFAFESILESPLGAVFPKENPLKLSVAVEVAKPKQNIKLF